MGTKLVDNASIEKIIKEMSVEEKARMVSGESPFHSLHLEKYGIPSIYMLDSCNGMNSMEYAGEALYQKINREAAEKGKPLDPEANGNMGGLLIALNALKKMAVEQAKSGAPSAKKEAGCYPPGIAMGATWNPEAIEAGGSAKAKELGSRGIHMILGPNINIHRDPLCGRLAEGYSEDPYLVSHLAPAEIKGIQDRGLIAVAKHFAANNQEKDRMGVDEHVSERALREIYLPAFKACADAGCKAFMSAYNNLNGVPSAQNEYLLTKILREEWGFQGFVVSDWGASYNLVDAVAAGTDLTMPGPRGVAEVIAAIEDGRLDEEKLDRAVRNILRNLLTSTAFTKENSVFDMKETVAVCENLAREGIVLLKNDGALPLPMDQDVVFYGKRSKIFVSCPAGSSNVVTDILTNPYDRAVELLGAGHVAFEAPTQDTKNWIVVAGADGQEGTDRSTLDIDEDEKILLEQAIEEARAVGGKVILILNATGPVNLEDYIENVDAVLCPFFAGMQGGKVACDTVFGLNNPSGKLPLTWPKKYADCPSYKNFPGENKEVWYGEGMYVGYRWYDAREIEPRFPFGFGLSYTNFELSDLRVTDEAGHAAEGIFDVENTGLYVTVSVKNTGQVAGSEVVQLYVHDVSSKFDRPMKELKGFSKVYLEPGEEKDVIMVLGKEDFAGYYLEFGEWITEPGEEDILVGTSSRDIKLCQRIIIKCKDPFGYSWRTAIGQIAKSPEAVAVVNRVIGDDILVVAHVAIEFAPDKSIKEIWGGTAMQSLLRGKGYQEEQIEEKWAELKMALDALNG